MLIMEKLFSLDELVAEYGRQCRKLKHLSGLGELSAATVRYYQQKGLFRPAGSSGKEVRYSDEALWCIIFTRLVQLQSTELRHTKVTLDTVARALQSLDREVVRRVAIGEEPLSVEVLATSEETAGEWANFLTHPSVRLDVKQKLTRPQQRQLKLIATLIESIVDNS